MSVSFGSHSKLKKVSPSAFRGTHKARIIEYPPSTEFDSDTDLDESTDDEEYEY